VLDLARKCGDFDVQMARLDAGDYIINGGVVVERKTYADFATSLADGRLFPQAAALARSPHRPVVLLEGPKPSRMPDVHPHALKGAIVSLAVMWRLPVLYARDPEDSLRVLRDLAHQSSRAGGVLPRYDRKPKRLASRKLYMLQGLPGANSSTGRSRLCGDARGHVGTVAICECQGPIREQHDIQGASAHAAGGRLETWHAHDSQVRRRPGATRQAARAMKNAVHCWEIV